MKRCPECRRDYFDDTLSYCLEDGALLVYGVSADETVTAILSEPPVSAGGLTQSIHPLGEAATASFSRGGEAEPQENSGDLSERQSLSAHRTAQPQSTINRLLAITGVVATLLIGGFIGYRYFSSANANQITTIAVMPFVNGSGNADVEYLSDGMTETLIRSLSQLPGLNVKARSSVFRYKGKETDAKTVANELGVQAVLNGRVMQRGEQLFLNLELIDARSENVIWTDQYDRKSADLVSLQNEIARDVSGKLKLKLSGADQQRLAKVYTNDPEAYRLYLQARFYLNKRVGKEYDRAEAILQQAVARDPNFALGFVGLAEFVDDDDRPRAKEYILRALAIDNQLSEAHAAYGYNLALDRDWAASERELERAIELDPRNVRAHQWNGTRLMFIGQHQECLAAYDRAIELEPTLADIRVNRGTCLVAAGRLDEGVAELKKATEIDPNYPWAHSALSFLYRMKGDHAASVESRARSAELVDRPDLAKRLRDVFRERGWRVYLQELYDQTSELFPNLIRRASILCELGKPDEALAILEQSAANGEWWLFAIKFDPAFDILRDEARFQALVKQFDPPQ